MLSNWSLMQARCGCGLIRRPLLLKICSRYRKFSFACGRNCGRNWLARTTLHLCWPGAEVACGLSLSLADCTFMLENRDSCIFQLLDCFLALWLPVRAVLWVDAESGWLHFLALFHGLLAGIFVAPDRSTLWTGTNCKLSTECLLWDAIVWHAHNGITCPAHRSCALRSAHINCQHMSCNYWFLAIQSSTMIQGRTSSYIALLQRRNSNCDSNLSHIRALIGLMSNPLWLKIRSTGAEVAGGENVFSNSGCIA